jgi:hypothetical protein
VIPSEPRPMNTGLEARLARASELPVFLGAFAALAAVFTTWIAWRISVPLEINVNEPWNAWHASNALAPDRLYPGRNALIVNNYPPLSFIVLRLVSPLFTNAIVAGRVLSILSVLLVGAATYRCARELGVGREPAALGGLWFIATITRFFSEYAGMNDPNFLGLAVAAWAFYVFLAARDTRTIYVAFFLMAVAGFIKHNLLAIPASAFVYLLITRPNLAIRVAIFGVAVCAIFAALTISVYGWNFVDQLIMPRQIALLRPLKSLGHLQWVAPVWPFWIVWLRWSSDRRANRITIILVVVGVATWLFWRLAPAVSENVQFELVFATSLCVAVTVEGLRERSIVTAFGPVALSAVFCVVLIVRLLASFQNDPYLLVTSPAYRFAIAQKSMVFDREVERIRKIPDPVSCSIRSVCYLAGKAFVFDVFAVQQLVATRRATDADMAVAASSIRFETIDQRARWDTYERR